MIVIPTEKRFDWQHAPVMLFGIILLNLFVFFVYQGGDNQKVIQVLESYRLSGYFEQEWPIYREYLEQQQESSQLKELERLHQQRDYQSVALTLLFDAGFFPFLSSRIRNVLAPAELRQWTLQRNRMHDTLQSISSLAHGLIPDKLELPDLVTHQFLHGSLMHLVGNLFFLAVCGFAVEAAIGHWRFLSFYLLAGMAGGLAHALTEPTVSQPLVGASGAISGVMAMYLAVFRFKRIEFFYWLFFLVGYIRAPALLILPFYIGKEVYSYTTNVDSNVAFMAHTGGFVAGAILIGGAWVLNRKLFNTDYIEQDQSIDPRQARLAAIYDAIEKFRFNQAYKLTDKMIREDGLTFELATLRYNLLKLKGGKSRMRAALAVINVDKLMPQELQTVANIWHDNPGLIDHIDPEASIKLCMRLTARDTLAVAENIFEELRQRECRAAALGVFARKLSVAFEAAKQPDKQAQYEQAAEALLVEAG